MLYSTLEMLFRHRWRYLVLLLVLPLIAAGACVYLFPKSTATESIWVQDQTLLPTTQPTYDTYLTPAQVIQSDLEQYIQTQTFADAVQQQLLSDHVVSSSTQASTIVGTLGVDLSAQTAGNNLLVLYYTCSAESLCPPVLSTAVNVYETYSAANLNTQVKVAEKAYQQQVTQAQAQLNQANAAVNAYLAQNPSENQATTTDPTLAGLQLNVTNAEQALQTAQGKLTGVQSQASTNQISSASLYTVMDPPRTVGGHIKNLPTRQMLIAAAAFWALALLWLILTARVSRVARHPNQLEQALGIQIAAVTQPIPIPGPARGRRPSLGEGASA